MIELLLRRYWGTWDTSLTSNGLMRTQTRKLEFSSITAVWADIGIRSRTGVVLLVLVLGRIYEDYRAEVYLFIVAVVVYG